MSEDPHSFTFAQRMGVGAMPVQARPGTIDEHTRSRLWVVVLEWLLSTVRHGYTHDTVRPPTSDTLLRWWVTHKHRMIDEMPRSYDDWKSVLKSEMRGDYISVYNLVQFLLSDTDFEMGDEIAHALKETRAAYRVTDDLLHPCVSDEEAATIEKALIDVGRHNASGAKSHLRMAASQLTSGDWAGSVHESISAAESAARFACGDEKTVLSVLVKQMRADGRIAHTCLQDAILKVYGYASDEKGVRHSQGAMEEQKVSEREAIFIFGMSAAMVSYLLNASPAT